MSADRKGFFWVGLALALMLLPVVAVGLNAFATDWAGSLLPLGFTLDWARQMLADPRFLQAFGNSMLLGIGATALSAAVCVPAIVVAHAFAPRLDRLFAGLVILPYAVPGIVMALGLLKLYAGQFGLILTGSPWLLVYAYVPLAASLYYVPIKNALRGLNVAELLEAGSMLGINDARLLWRVILPSIRQAVVIGVILNFTLVVSEFVYANLLVGGQFPTLQIFMYVLRGGSGHLQSVLILIYFALVLIATTAVALLAGSEQGKRS
jgi:putative spermidine/putrescine transport system permease protein